jgi:hypothetical protein
MRIYPLFILLVLFANQTALGQNMVPATYIGDWAGTVHQDGFSSYEVSVAIAQGKMEEISGKINYTTLGCGGDLIYKGIHRDKDGVEYAEFKEVLRYGEGQCLDNGTVLLYIHDKQLKFVWQHQDYPDSGATAELSRL